MTGRAAALFLSLMLSTVSYALPPENGPEHRKAKAISESAGVKFQQKQYQEAARLFEQAYGHYPSAKLLYNLALVWEEDGKFDRAVSVLERYLKQTDAVRINEVKKWRHALEKRLSRTHGRVTLNVLPKGTEMAVGVTLVTSPWEGWLPATEHTLRVNRTGYESMKLTFKVQAGQKTNVSASLKPRGKNKRATAMTHSLSDASQVSAGTKLAPWGWSTLGTGIAVVAVGLGVNLGLGFETAREADGLDPMQADYKSRFDSKIDDAEKLNSIGYALYGLGGALIATGTTLLVLDSLRGSNTAVNVSVTPLSAGGWVALTGRF